jgi:hypothetical protein
MRTKFMLGIAGLFIATMCYAQALKPKIVRVEDVPVFKYPFKVSTGNVIESEVPFHKMAVELRKHTESVLKNYDISDTKTKVYLLGILLELDVLENRDSSARKLIMQIKALTDTPSAKAMVGLIETAILDTRKQITDRNSPAYRQALVAAFKRSLDALPFDLVQKNLKMIKDSFDNATELTVINILRATVDPAIVKNGGVPGYLLSNLPEMRMLVREILPFKDELAKSIGACLTAHAKDKKNN